MKAIAFYIIERPQSQYMSSSFSEYKDDELLDSATLAAVEDKWMYAEDISVDYAFAQSVLFKVYGSTVQETGHKTKGHTCVTDTDRDNAKNNKGSLLYGELLPRGANKAFGPAHLHVADARALFDLGMGAGKVAVQAFVQYRNLDYVYGVELSAGRCGGAWTRTRTRVVHTLPHPLPRIAHEIGTCWPRMPCCAW